MKSVVGDIMVATAFSRVTREIILVMIDKHTPLSNHTRLN